jgi:[ribosomal protein S5]-alanine N-acetyltransferase
MRSLVGKKKIANALQVGFRVYIRSPKSSDCDEFIALNHASRRFYRGWASAITQPQQFANYLKRCCQSDHAGFLIFRLEDDAILGSINLSQIFRGGFQSAYMGYQIGAPYANQGYMTEAVQLTLRYAFTKLKLHRVEANIQPNNVPSKALVKRLGFTLEGYSRRYLKISGRWRDHERWAILAEDWRVSGR